MHFNDSDYASIENRFEMGAPVGPCTDNGRNESGHIIPDTCSGGVLADRDDYLASKNVLMLGEWYRGSAGDTETWRALYFKYWFSD